MALPSSPFVRTVCVGMPQDREWAGIGRTAIEKRSVAGPVQVRRLGLEGDAAADARHQVGVEMALFGVDREELDHWEGVLGSPLRDGQFGENLTVQGLRVDDAEVGEHWRIGSALLEVCSVRIPCANFATWQTRNGYDATGWLRRFTEHGRSGAYLRVLQEGALRAGDAIEVVHRPGHGVTVTTMFRALTTERALLAALLDVPGLVPQARAKAEAYVATLSTS
ncbi:MAG: MOSC domain-containing protein [Marmoricola sp.]